MLIQNLDYNSSRFKNIYTKTLINNSNINKSVN